ncbi:hypothetical protein ACIBG8_18480 [Nonomuraea sp. NPDC050556]|uniref:hypothetical protein n=1 Tax=Nonomuraea sp. NPDC050556 TaxID=3364369 RepID=UPI0037978261
MNAADFMAGHARLLDRRRFQLLMGEIDAAGVLAALNGYRNPDGGYGWGLEPDLRAPESQPGAALHAFEVFAELPPAREAVELCDWLDSVSLPDGGLPFALPVSTAAGTAPWWRGPDAGESSLQITAISAAWAYRVPGLADHPWLARATRYCLDAVDALNEAPHAYILLFAVRLLDELGDTERLDRLAKHIPADGRVRVQGGTEAESLHPLDFAPYPGTPARALFTPEVVEADLDRLAALQQEDGGWVVDYAVISPAGALDWRGATTVRAVEILRANGRL